MKRVDRQMIFVCSLKVMRASNLIQTAILLIFRWCDNNKFEFFLHHIALDIN